MCVRTGLIACHSVVFKSDCHLSVQAAGGFRVSSMLASVTVGTRHHMRRVRLVLLAIGGLVPLVRRDVEDRLGVPVISRVQHDHVFGLGCSGEVTSHAQREVVRF